MTAAVDPSSTVHGRFRACAAAAPDRPALVWDGGSLTYAELDARTEALALRLVDAGVQVDDPVALCLDRSAESVVAALAILKAGGAYLPLDAHHPIERLRFTAKDAGAAVLVTGRDRGDRLHGMLPRTVLVDDTAQPGNAVVPHRGTARSLAYVLYTSGSTGTPKGVLIEHRSVLRLVSSVDYVRLDPDTVMLHAAPLGFDASTLELWGPLLNGGCCALHPELVPTARGLAATIARHGVTTAWLTAALFNAVIDESPGSLRRLRQLLTGGEALSVPHVRRALAALPDTELINGYGPTECTTFVTTYSIPRVTPEGARSIPIGRPIAHTRVHVLDERLAPVAAGDVGELYVGGLGVARGYLRRPELDAERFVPDPFAPGEVPGRLYRTGDRVRLLAGDVLDFVERADDQVKVRGFRIEPGEVEAALLRCPGVKRCAVVAREDGATGKRLVAYLVGDGALPPMADVRASLLHALPEFMVPAAFVVLPALPVSANGKLDRGALPAPTGARPELAQPYRAPHGATEEAICRVFAEVLELDTVGSLDGFFELGGNSLLAVRLAGRLAAAGIAEVSPVTLFEAPSPAQLARAIGGSRSLQAPEVNGVAARRPRGGGPEPIAIVGMAGRFPGAPDVETFWSNLCAGRESITFFAPDDLDPSIAAEVRDDPAYVRARGVLDDVEQFDAAFFGITPLEAQLMDPQHRVFLEVCWHALENAGHAPETTEGAIGVFGGMYNATYYQRHVLSRPDLVARLGELQVMLGNEKDYVTSRAAHRLGLTGPAVSIHTACSTSLVAAAAAIDSLRNGSCDIALAGGVAITCPPRSGYLFQEGSMASPDGHTRTFDERAGGTVFSDGAAMVVLRRLADAQRDGDTVYAVILGAAVNNDGAARASFTAPSADGQARVIAAAQDAAGVDPRSISYVEAHGTATPLGDPIEIEGLTRAFRRATGDTAFCGIGSLKSNVGHMVIAAGAASLIKTALALHTRTLPPSLHCDAPNPRIDFARTPFVVVRRLTSWPAGATALRAGVSSFGFGGTNAHLVLEEAPPPAPAAASTRPVQLLLLSARSDRALDQAATRLAAALTREDAPALADAAHSLRTGRRAFPLRRFVVAADGADAARLLHSPAPPRCGRGSVGALVPEIGFLFPGQGAQYAAMGSGLYRTEPVYQAAYDECCRVIAAESGSDPRPAFFSEDPGALTPTSLAQPAIFALEYSLARLLMSFGLQPTALVGHSVGEFVCAVIAGVMSLDDGLRLVVERGRLMQALPAGKMLSVRLPAAQLAPRLPPGVVIAAENGPSLAVASGPAPAIAQLEAELGAAGIPARPLVTSHAFHSAMMDPAIEPMEARARSIALAAPRVPIVSTVSAEWLGADEACRPRYWAEHLRRTVRFHPAVATALADPRRVLIEIGPRATLSTLARQAVAVDRALPPAIPTLADAPAREPESLATALGHLWSLGTSIDWRAYCAHERRVRVPLPGYPFQRQRHWIDAAPAVQPDRPEPAAPAPDDRAPPAHAAPPPPAAPSAPPTEAPARGPRLLAQLRTIVEEVSGTDVSRADPAASWLDIGLDSLTITQLALQIQRAFPVKVSFRQIMESYPSMDALVGLLDESLPADAAPDAVPAGAQAPAAADARAGDTAAAGPGSEPSPYVRQVIDQQLQLMARQLEMLGHPAAAGAAATVMAAGAGVRAGPAPPPINAPPGAPPGPPLTAPDAAPSSGADDGGAPVQRYDVKKAFGAIARIHTRSDALTPEQRERLASLIERYGRRTARSKEYTARNRDHMADPRVVNGFRPLTKEMTYQIVMERSRGSRMWDIDGHEYIDVLSGFGMNLLGWQSDIVRAAVHRQIDLGFEIGPQHVLAGEVAGLVCELTGAERAAFCNTGSEAVMGTMRIARTVTGRSTIAIFSGAYHGIFDEVIVRGTRKLGAVPAAPGILPSSAHNMLVLDYATPESLAVLRERADDLAAILVEPVQSRRPDLQPRAFLHELRALTERSGTVLIFDEVVTGFRAHPGGAQAVFGVRADLATYGKVVGGGFPIGIIAGKRQFMDALDGGAWSYGDDSMPTVGVTYFAGTFVRHPLALAAARAVLEHLRAEGPGLQEKLNARTAAMADELNRFFSRAGAPLRINHFASLFRTAFTEDLPCGDLLFAMMRLRGIHILDHFPCFITAAHTDEDIRSIVAAFRDSVIEMQRDGFLPRPARVDSFAVPPVPGARLGRNRDGSPAWFVPDDERPGKFLVYRPPAPAPARPAAPTTAPATSPTTPASEEPLQ